MGLPSAVVLGAGVLVGTVVTAPSSPQPTIPQNKATIVRVDATCLAIRIVMRVRPYQVENRRGTRGRTVPPLDRVAAIVRGDPIEYAGVQ